MLVRFQSRVPTKRIFEKLRLSKPIYDNYINFLSYVSDVSIIKNLGILQLVPLWCEIISYAVCSSRKAHSSYEEDYKYYIRGQSCYPNHLSCKKCINICKNASIVQIQNKLHTFPVLRTPFHSEKYTKTNTPNRHRAKEGFMGPILSSPSDLYCSSTLRLKKK